MEKSLVRKLISLAAVVYPLLIATGSLSRPPRVLSASLFSDKIAHALAYFVLTLVWFFLLDGVRFRESKQTQNLTRVAVFAFLYGTLLEALQWKLTSYRTADHWDLLANGVGIGLALLLLSLTRKIWGSLKMKF
ncbi:VanZ family protein [Croceiramulus getboli]|nr:VanZ family protein [Flavobacteriaceae bacterium YJPT1-3]